MKKALVLAAVAAWLLLAMAPQARAQAGFHLSINQGSQGSGLQVSIGNGESGNDLSGLLKIFLLFTVVSLAPAILVLCTSFTRIIIVLTFLRQAMGVQNVPPNQVLIALALFLTAFNMLPVWQQIQTQAVKPYQDKKLSWEAALQTGSAPLRLFMLEHTRPKDLNLFLKLSRAPKPKSIHDLSLLTVIPAFVISELRVAFQIGFLLYLPFIVVDMVVASILLSMGMMMLPPIMVSLPFKILLFVMVDGWNLLITSLMKSFY